MTSPALEQWPPTDLGHHRFEVTAVIGHGRALWERASRDVLRWRVKTASGFAVDTTGPVAEGDRATVTARVLGLTVAEPVEVVTVVQDSDRFGFAYKTLPGHPVSGEEAFIVHRDGDEVRLARSLALPRSSHGAPPTRCCGSPR